MQSIRFALLGVALLSLSINLSAQDAEKLQEGKRREFGLLNEILADANNLKLPENRAIVYAQAASRIWTYDENQSRELFEASITELIRAQIGAEDAVSGDQNSMALRYGQNPRHRILNILANHDAKFALDAMTRSRPALLAAGITRYGKSVSRRSRYSSLSNFVQSELQNERRIMTIAARQDPAAAEEFILKSIRNGVDSSVIGMLNELNKTDPSTSSDLAEKAIRALSDTKIEGDIHPLHNTLLQFLQAYGREDKREFEVKVSRDSIRLLADKISSIWMRPEFRSFSLESLPFKIVETIYPERAETFRRRQEQYNGQYQDQNAEQVRYTELVNGKLTADELLNQAATFSAYRTSILEYAFRKLTEEGNIRRIEAILANDFPPEEASMRLSHAYTSLATREAGKGNYTGALDLVDRIPDETRRFHALINLASSSYSQKPEDNKQFALSVLSRAETLLSQNLRDRNEIAKLVSLCGGYSTVEPDRAFRYFELAIPPVNEYIRSYAVVSEFRREGRVRKGEFLIMVGTDPIGEFNLAPALQGLKQHDFARSLELANRFDQLETRIGLKLQILGNIGSEQIVNLPIRSSRIQIEGLRPRPMMR